jgi:formate hydrogenlyase subunit 3/multisubunit Na+/H+ antiporter MnhD subunit
MAGLAWSPGAAHWIAAAAVLWPLVLGLAACWRATAPAVVRVAPWAALPALLLALGSRDAWLTDVPWLLLGARIGLDLTGRVFLLLGSLVWLCAGLAARPAMRTDANPARFYAFFLLSMAGSLGLPLAGDAATFYVLFALMSVSAYGLVAHQDDAEARRAGRAYIVFAIVGEVLLVSGLFFAVRAAGTANLDELPARMLARPAGLMAVPLILLGCGIKAGAVPLHAWLPVSYAAAPLPATVALAGTMSKAGVLGWLRLLPLGHVSLGAWGVPMVLLGIVAAFYGVAVGLCQRDAKTALAYSSVSQVGVLTAAVGLGTITPSGWALLLPAVLVYSLHHGLAKGALFLTLGVSGAGGAAPATRRAAVAAAVALGLSLAGMTLTSGAAAKSALKDAISASGAPSAGGIAWTLSLAAIGTTLLMARVVWLLGAPAAEIAGGARRETGEAAGHGGAPVAAWTLAAGLSLAAPWTLMGGLAGPSAAWSIASVPYILAGVASAGIVTWLSMHGWWRWRPQVPVGDILVPLEWAAARVWLHVSAKPAPHGDAQPPKPVVEGKPPSESAAPPLERALLRWPVYGLVVLALLAAAAAALVLGAA